MIDVASQHCKTGFFSLFRFLRLGCPVAPLLTPKFLDSFLKITFLLKRIVESLEACSWNLEDRWLYSGLLIEYR
jgi:hypothetical protein